MPLTSYDEGALPAQVSLSRKWACCWLETRMEETHGTAFRCSLTHGTASQQSLTHGTLCRSRLTHGSRRLLQPQLGTTLSARAREG